MAEEIKTEPRAEAAKAPETVPVSVVADIGKSIAEQMTKSLAEIRREEQERSAASAPVQAPVQAPIDDVSDEQIEQAAAEGKGLAALLRKRELANRERWRREADASIAQGSEAISQLGIQVISAKQHFKKYEKEIRAQVEQLKRNYPGVLIQPAHWENAYTFVVGQHAEEIVAQTREEAIRAARDPAPAQAAPAGTRSAPEPEAEPATLSEALGRGFQDAFQMKQRKVGARSEDAEVQLLDRAYRAVMQKHCPAIAKDEKRYKKPVADYLQERKEMQQLAEEDPSLGLGM